MADEHLAGTERVAVDALGRRLHRPASGSPVQIADHVPDSRPWRRLPSSYSWCIANSGRGPDVPTANAGACSMPASSPAPSRWHSRGATASNTTTGTPQLPIRRRVPQPPRKILLLLGNRRIGRRLSVEQRHGVPRKILRVPVRHSVARCDLRRGVACQYVTNDVLVNKTSSLGVQSQDDFPHLRRWFSQFLLLALWDQNPDPVVKSSISSPLGPQSMTMLRSVWQVLEPAPD
jgi:hypothetical protein